LHNFFVSIRDHFILFNSTFLFFSGVTVPQPLTLRFHLLVDDQPIGSLPLKVLPMPLPGSPPPR